MTRGRAAGLAVLVLGLLAWRLFQAAPRGGPVEEGDPGPGRASVSESDTHTPGIPGKADARADAGRTPKSAAAADAPAPPLAESTVSGVCVLEDGTPLAGVIIAELGGSGEASHAVTSEVDGTFSVKADSDRPILMVFTGDSQLVGAEGALLLPSGNRPFTKIQVEGPALRLLLRDKPGTAHVRLVNADTSEPVTVLRGLHVRWLVRGGFLSMGYPLESTPGGWIPIPEGRLPERGIEPDEDGEEKAGIKADLSKVEVEFVMPGFEKGRLPLADIKGRMEVRVRPVPPDATGEVAFNSAKVVAGEFEPHTSATLRWTGPDPPPSKDGVLGLPVAMGPFSLYDLPDGPWVIEVSTTLPDNTVVRGKRAFEKHGGTVDLGTIELVPAGKVVIRVVDSAGEPIPQAWAVIVRPEENPDQGRRLDLDQNGRVAVGDLEPGIGHRVVVKGLPRDLEQTVVAAADAKPVEFKWTEKLVPCRITLIVDGKAVANPDGRTTIPAVVQESPMPRDKGAWKSDGTFEAKLVPGNYKFSALATPKEGGDLALFSGEVTVPSGDSYEVRLELQRGGK